MIDTCEMLPEKVQCLTRRTSGRLRVAYLVGTGHCGSSLMALLMDSHPQIVSVGEVSPGRRSRHVAFETQSCSCGVILNECPFWTHVFDAMRQQGFASPWAHDYRYAGTLAHRVLTAYSSYRLAQWFQRTCAEILPYHRQRIRRVDRANVAFISSALKWKGAEVFVDTTKTLTRLSRLLGINELDVQIIRVVRDVRAFVNSNQRKGRSLAASAESWTKFQQTADAFLRQISQDKIIQIRYEDLCDDMAGTLARLFDFLGVEPMEPNEIVTPREHHILGNRMRRQLQLTVRRDDAWRKDLLPSEIDRTLRIGGPINQRFGYR